MTSKDFIKELDRDGSVILLEGKRKVPKADRKKPITLGKRLVAGTFRVIFRSGNVAGAYQLFSEGIASVNSKQSQVIIPYSGRRQKNNRAYYTILLDNIHTATEPEVIYHSKTIIKKQRSSLGHTSRTIRIARQ